VKNAGNHKGTKNNEQSEALYFLGIAKAITKKYALHSIYYFCFLKEMYL